MLDFEHLRDGRLEMLVRHFLYTAGTVSEIRRR
jgi:hypothetical protein